jgi:hypothetical protein
MHVREPISLIKSLEFEHHLGSMLYTYGLENILTKEINKNVGDCYKRQPFIKK